MQRLWSITTGYALVALCCFSQPASESKAEERWLRDGVIAATHTAVAAALMTEEGIRLAQSSKRAETREGSDTWKRTGETVVSGGDEPTKVEIRGNSVLVPVTLAYGGNEVDVHLLLDTGASRTLIHTAIADQLSINLNNAKKTKVRIVGGAVIEARMIKINSVTVGPHTNRNWDIIVVQHQGSDARYDGLLGMDVLRGLKYKVDFKKQVIVWE